MHIFGGGFNSLQGFNRTSHEQIDITCPCCNCTEYYSLKNSSDIENLKCRQTRANFDSLRAALFAVFQVCRNLLFHENSFLKYSPRY